MGVPTGGVALNVADEAFAFMAKVSEPGAAVQAPNPGVAGVYLLHFDWSHPDYGWQHYIGWSRNLPARIAAHRRGDGSRVSREALKAGIGFRVVRVWPGATRHEEQAFQALKGRNLCPACCPAVAEDGHGGDCYPRGGPW
jgi:hypothetical protein